MRVVPIWILVDRWWIDSSDLLGKVIDDRQSREENDGRSGFAAAWTSVGVVEG